MKTLGGKCLAHSKTIIAREEEAQMRIGSQAEEDEGELVMRARPGNSRTASGHTRVDEELAEETQLC